MSTDDEIKRLQGQRLAEARAAAGFKSARAAALEYEWKESTYRAHEAGTRTIGLDDAMRYARRFKARGVKVTAQDILFGTTPSTPPPAPEPRRTIAIMGNIGAGGDIDVDFEQAPADGFDQIELPASAAIAAALVEDPIGLRVKGLSMYPRYNDGDVLIVSREQPWGLDSMIGNEVAVVTEDNRRFIKRIQAGPKRQTVNLESIDPHVPTMVGVRIRWASPVRIIIPNIGLRTIASARSGQRRR